MLDGAGSPVVACDYDAASLPTILDNFCRTHSAPERILVANVAGDTAAMMLTRACREIWSKEPEYLAVKNEYRGFTQGYPDRNRLGIDRWLAMLAAWNRYQSELCVIDCGSAVTIDIISDTGIHQGGYIIPGSHLMQQALARDTAGITLPENTPLSDCPGLTTAECVVNGTVIAVVASIEYIARNTATADKDLLPCVITGGGADKVMEKISIPCRHEPHLVMEGIRLAAGC